MPPLNTFTRSCIALAIGQAAIAPAHAANIIVNNTGDTEQNDALCTLREAIASANDEPNTSQNGCIAGDPGLDTISFNAAVLAAGQIYVSQSAPLRITDDVTISGPAVGTITVNGNGNARVVQVQGAFTEAELNNLLVTGGNTASNGGGILVNYSHLTLNSVSVQGNSADVRGGGISAYLATVTINNSTISGNTSSLDSVRGRGGGIESNGSTITLNNSQVTNNSGDGGGGIDCHNFNDKYCKLTLSNTRVSGNTGFGIILSTRAQLDLMNSRVSDNSSGGIYVGSSDAGVTVTDSTVSNNRGLGGITIKSFPPEGTSLVIDRSAIYGNDGEGTGGGLTVYGDTTLTLLNSTVSGNLGVRGGGIYLSGDTGGFGDDDGQTATITNSTITGNSASFGGGMYFSDCSYGICYSLASGSNNIISGNSASTGSEIRRQTGAIINFLGNLLGDARYNNAQSFAGITLTPPFNFNIYSTSDGNQPTALNSILTPLSDYGGPTYSHALLRGSPAVNSGDNADCGIGKLVAIDQRGEPREDGQCDMGAFEGFIDNEACTVVRAVNGNTVVFCL